MRDFPLWDTSEFRVRPWYARWAYFILKDVNPVKMCKWHHDRGFASGYNQGRMEAWQEYQQERIRNAYPAYAPLEERNTGPAYRVDVQPLQAMSPRMRWKAMKAMHPEAGYETMEHYVFGKGDMEP